MADTPSGAGRFTLFLGIAAAAGLVFGPFLTRFEVIPPMAGFAAFALGGLLGVITFVVGLIGAARRGVVSAGPVLVVGLLVSGVFMSVVVPTRSLPRINDISTDILNPPQFVIADSLPGNQGRDMRYPGKEFAEQQRRSYPQLEGLKINAPPQQVFQHVVATAREMPDWEITRNDSAARALEAVSTSKWFRFKDDLVIEVRADNGGSIVQMRSKSRNGKGDAGANATRIKAFFAKLEG
jgi:uncharacterized protein (DUF1499 family)